ncbi:hypothetical protein XA68_18204 [Ophiocordyceps unilateralis]|uniref:U4/U6.U5 small nuclear ribonucleoprotein 27kDa protein domain-containing protein n=1 Tax=Ophiocordyceps unilateralis TaxID=268505 RepID=A0A2A9PRR1_OPHUN|nr:hypothetical protein XA68_18204 [Ophiocordyceps unilateralis]
MNDPRRGHRPSNHNHHNHHHHRHHPFSSSPSSTRRETSHSTHHPYSRHRHRSRSPPRRGRSRTPPPRRSHRSRSPRPSRSPLRRPRSPLPPPKAVSEQKKAEGEKPTKTGADDQSVAAPTPSAQFDSDMDAMQAMMGFGDFGSTKGKKIPGNDAGAVRKEKKTEYRQYMNRQGGFNRPLSPTR